MRRIAGAGPDRSLAYRSEGQLEAWRKLHAEDEDRERDAKDEDYIDRRSFKRGPSPRSRPSGGQRPRRE